RDELERVAGQQGLVTGSRFHGRFEMDGFRAKLTFSRRRSEPAVRERQKRVANAEANGMFLLQFFESNPGNEGMAAGKQSTNHVIVAVVQTRILQIHGGGEATEHFGIRQRFTRRGKYRSRQLQVVVAVSKVEVRV